MRDAAAAIVPDEREALEAQRLHDLDLILRHRAFGIRAVVRFACGLA